MPALDRQHPRDLFDVKHFLESAKFDAVFKEGLFLALLSSNRPLEELLYPNFLDQKATLTNQFLGMTNEPFDYLDFEKARTNLTEQIHESLTSDDKEFQLSFQRLEPDWTIYDFEHFPSIQWKLQNLKRLKANNFKKYEEQLDRISNKLSSNFKTKKQ